MSVTVKFFASLRENVGVGEISLDVDGMKSIEDVLTVIASELGIKLSQRLRDEDVTIAVNQEIVKGPVILRDGDEIAFLPPITGG